MENQQQYLSFRKDFMQLFDSLEQSANQIAKLKCAEDALIGTAKVIELKNNTDNKINQENIKEQINKLHLEAEHLLSERKKAIEKIKDIKRYIDDEFDKIKDREEKPEVKLKEMEAKEKIDKLFNYILVEFD